MTSKESQVRMLRKCQKGDSNPSSSLSGFRPIQLCHPHTSSEVNEIIQHNSVCAALLLVFGRLKIFIVVINELRTFLQSRFFVKIKKEEKRKKGLSPQATGRAAARHHGVMSRASVPAAGNDVTRRTGSG